MATTRKVFQDKAESLVEQHELTGLSTAPETLRTGAGRLQWFVPNNSGSAAMTWLKFYDKATAPVHATDVPVLVWPIEAGKKPGVQIMPSGSAEGTPFTSGIHVLASNGAGPTGGAPTPELSVTVGVI